MAFAESETEKRGVICVVERKVWWWMLLVI